VSEVQIVDKRNPRERRREPSKYLKWAGAVVVFIGGILAIMAYFDARDSAMRTEIQKAKDSAQAAENSAADAKNSVAEVKTAIDNLSKDLNTNLGYINQNVRDLKEDVRRHMGGGN